MRSKSFHAAIAQGNTRFQICQIVAKGVRITHKHGNRLEDSITTVMGMLKTKPNATAQPEPSVLVA